MNELQLQEKYVIDFFCYRKDGLGYREATSGLISDDLFLVKDLQEFLSQTDENKDSYKKLVRKYAGDEKKLMEDFVEFLECRLRDYTNTAIFINDNKTLTFEGLKFNLFYTSGSDIFGDKLFDQNIFSICQEYSYSYKIEGKKLFSFRPDLSFFVNGIYFGYCELKSNYTGQNAWKNGKNKIAKDYLEAVREYAKIAKGNDINQSQRKSFLKIFEKAVHITTTDIGKTYISRTIANNFEEARKRYDEGFFDAEGVKKIIVKDFKEYPTSKILPGDKIDKDKELEKVYFLSKTESFEEVCRALYSKEMIEKEILYYNFIEKEVVKSKDGKTYKNQKGRLIAPRPKQKFGTDKILSKIDEFLEHESDDLYFINKLKKQLEATGASQSKIDELINQRLKYQNNKNAYSLLLQYAAGFGKSNIIGWTTLQLKDLKKDNQFVYDKVMIIVDRLQLRDQIDDKMYNMNINNKMFVEADSKKTFIQSLESNTRIVIVNLQKFGSIKEFLDNDTVSKLANMRIAFLIDEIHRSHSGQSHQEMISLFDEMQNSFDNAKTKKKNLLIGFTATPSDNTLARFGEFSGYAESEKIWVPFDSFTMADAIKDGFILNPLSGIVPVSSKMYFEKPEDILEGFEGDSGYEEITDKDDTGIDDEGKKYAIRKKKIYANEDRIEAISKFIAKRLVTSVYPQIRGYGKAMLAVSSIPNSIKYFNYIKKYYDEIIKETKYQRFENAPIFIVYTSSSQNYPSSTSLNDGLSESKVLQEFALAKNGLIIVVDKLQTGFDEKKLHTLFLDKEIKGINAIQTISRVNRTTKYKNDCKIIDFSYRNVNVKNIKKAFEHFSNIVISDFNPLEEEKIMAEFYLDLASSFVYENYFNLFQKTKSENDTHKILEIQNHFNKFIKSNPKKAEKLKNKIGKYFRILKKLDFVIDFDPKYNNLEFIEFWKKFIFEYNLAFSNQEIIDDIEVYYDYKLGIIEAEEETQNKEKPKAKLANRADDENKKKYKFNIISLIEERNKQELELEQKILEFESKIEDLFEHIKTGVSGKRLVAKIKDKGAFSESEILEDFDKVYKSYIRRNRNKLGNFFIKETKQSIAFLCDEFEKWLLDLN